MLLLLLLLPVDRNARPPRGTMRLTTLLLLLLSAAAAPFRADAPAGAARAEDAVEAVADAGSGAFRGERGGGEATATIRRLPAPALDETERQRGGSGALPAPDGAIFVAHPSGESVLRAVAGAPSAARPRLLPFPTGPPATARPSSS